MENFCKSVFMIDPIVLRDRERLHTGGNVIKYLAMSGQIERYKFKGFFRKLWRGKRK